MELNQYRTSTINDAIIFTARATQSQEPCRANTMIMFTAYLHQSNSCVILHIPLEMFMDSILTFIDRTEQDKYEENGNRCLRIAAQGSVLPMRTFNVLEDPSVSPRYTVICDSFTIHEIIDPVPAEIALLDNVAPPLEYRVGDRTLRTRQMAEDAQERIMTDTWQEESDEEAKGYVEGQEEDFSILAPMERTSSSLGKRTECEDEDNYENNPDYEGLQVSQYSLSGHDFLSSQESIPSRSISSRFRDLVLASQYSQQSIQSIRSFMLGQQRTGVNPTAPPSVSRARGKRRSSQSVRQRHS
ncbi:uncharacterized protein B0P05DRAFT_594202 [Gilbertella persicaria]|uniref:Uncharacterized protein n=1 Tax=Rhizopus stolonifer TaxID=4846 RepID=A0A367IZ75_RHIST|nr:uncharacterized protein B0P05DRAFT_594202 [Gilbertella persicaria]KAI8091489.1 hypothetical protein B0P05DRAFT_594202 [Gilbertella persicaria]RCH82988.1 hypothetical protein CU098_007156 [Rhizopus stolonifer]